MEKKSKEINVPQSPCIICHKLNPAPYARVRGTDVVCSKRCNEAWEKLSFDEKHPH